jgi:hypothetical protein
VRRAEGWRQKAETTRVPALVGSARTSTPASDDTPVIRSSPPAPAPSWAGSTPYVAGSGGKKASRAATDDVTLPILPFPLPPPHEPPQWPAGCGCCLFRGWAGGWRTGGGGRNVRWVALARAELRARFFPPPSL